MKYHIKLEKSAAETYLLLKDEYDNLCLSHRQVFKWLIVRAIAEIVEIDKV